MSARDDHRALAAIEVEQAILGGLLLDNSAWDRVGDLLRPEHFALDLHRVVFAELARQIEARQPADVITVSSALGDRASMADVHALAQYLPGNASLHRYAGILIDRHRSRELLAASGEVADIAQEHETPIDERIDAAQAALAKLAADAPRDEWLGAYEGMLEHTAVLEARAEGRIASFPTGLRDFDEQTDGGLRPGQLIVLAARPAMGKTALVLSIAAAMAADRPVGLLSMEMSHADINDRLVSLLGRVPLSAVLRPTKGDGLEWSRVLDGTERAKSLKFFASDQPGLNVRQVAAKARGLKRRHGLSVLCIDYVGLMSGTDPKQSRAYQIEEITRSLKILAKELGIVIVLLAQLNRGVEQRADQTPVLSDLRDSGAIEQDADIVVLLHRPIVNKPDLGFDWSEYAKLRVAKVRQGRTGDIHLRFVGEQTRFEDWQGPIPKRGVASSKGAEI